MAAADRIDRLHDVHREQQSRLVDVVAGVLRARLLGLENLSDEQRDLYVAAAVPVVQAGQRRAAAIAAGYARALAPSRDPRGRLDLNLDELLVTADTAWITSPVLRARAELAAGAEWRVALDVAASKARGYVSGDLAVAQRHGIARGAAATGANVTGYRKVLAASACSWCRAVSGRLYRAADSVPFHERDACSVAPVFD